MKILLLGGNGQVGWELRRSLAVLGELSVPLRPSASAPISATASEQDGLCGDMEDLAGLAASVRRLRPDVIVNAAAYTAVDRAESERDKAHRINALAVGVLAEEAERCGAWLIHYSSDYVFDGSGVKPWTEQDPCAPLSVYGASKLEGETLAQSRCSRLLILRTSWVYASRGGNFARTMVRLASERDELKVVDDQIGAPTGADLIADVTAHALRQLQAQRQLAGLYHLSAGGETSWFGYARHVLAVAEQMGLPLRVRADQVLPVASDAFPSAARRPKNSRLNSARACQAFGLHLPDWKLGVERMLSETLPPHRT